MDRTKTGRLSTTAETLERLAYRPEIRPYLRWRWTGHRLSTFGAPLLEMIHPVTGRIHGDFIHCATKAGRLTCRDPNVQQLPDDCRIAIQAPESKLLVWVDWNQIELRVLGELSGCRALRSVYAAGQDVHRITGALMAGVPEAEITEDDPRRDAAKPINYGITYGGGPATLAASAFREYGIELTVEQARAAKTAFLRRFPGVAAYQETMSREPVVWSIAGRVLRPEWESAGEISYTQRLNYSVQSSAADILLTAMIEIDRALPSTMILSLHDEIVLEVDEDQAEVAAKTLADCMTAAVLKWFPIAPTGGLVKPKVGRVWS
jgi:DNA polymerase-1